MVQLSSIFRHHGLSVDGVYTLFHGHLDDFPLFEFTRRDDFAVYRKRLGPLPYLRPFSHHELQWIHEEWPFLAFIPRDPFHGPLFNRLDYKDDTLSIVPVRRGYVLKPLISDSWQSLERNCTRAVHGLMTITSGRALPRGFQLFPTAPHRFRYDVVYKTEKDVRVIAKRTREAFLPLMGALSLLILIAQQLSTPWQERLAEATGIHRTWIACLANSVLVDYQTPRLGGIIEARRLRFPQLLTYFKRVNMPLVLAWGPTDASPEASVELYDAGCVPSNADLDALDSPEAKQRLVAARQASLARRTTLNTSSSTINYRSSTPNPPPRPTTSIPPDFPRVYHGSGQAPGVTMDQFFQRRALRHVEIEARETATTRQAREDREKNALRHACPGRKGSTVFFWEEVDGYRLRRPAGRSSYSHYWEVYGRTQRRYDPFFDEWDLSSVFDPTEDTTVEPRFDSDDDSDVEGPEASSPPPTFAELPAQEDSTQDLHHEYAGGGSDNASEPPNLPLVFDTMEDLAFYKYGFYKEHQIADSRCVASAAVVRWTLGQGLTRKDDTAPPVSDDLCHFFGWFMGSQTKDQLPPPIYDLHQTDSDINLAPKKLRLYRVGGQDACYYVLYPLGGLEPKLAILVQSPVAVLEVLRRHWDGDATNLAHELVNRCIPFNVCIRGPARVNQNPVVLPTVPSIGIRPQGYQVDGNDFSEYERMRNEFFYSARGHLAHRFGGLVARLARDVIPCDTASTEPSYTVYEEGVFIVGHGPGYYDDTLSEAELDLICGVYAIATGQMQGEGMQTRRISWWPKPAAWAKCGLWPGYWTADCEQWFQSRLTSYRQGNMKLQTQQEWGHSLKFNAKAARNFKRNNEFSATFLTNLPSSSLPPAPRT